MDKYNLPAAALAASVLYALWNLRVDSDTVIEDAQPDQDHDQLVQDVKSHGIPVHLIDNFKGNVAVRGRRPADTENPSGAPVEESHDYAAKVLETMKQVGADEVFNAARVPVFTPDSHVKPLTVMTVSAPFPGVPETYVYQWPTGIRPKVGRNEDPY